MLQKSSDMRGIFTGILHNASISILDACLKKPKDKGKEEV